jgi:chromosome segregation ATPase
MESNLTQSQACSVMRRRAYWESNSRSKSSNLLHVENAIALSESQSPKLLHPNIHKDKQRKPLGILSPNAHPGSCSSNLRSSEGKKGDCNIHSPQCSNDSVLQQLPSDQQTNSDSRDRARILDLDIDKSALVALINEKDEICRRKDEQLHMLEVKLSDIQQGLSSIESERQVLTEKAYHLQTEQNLLQKQLANREQEILSLSRRCASQAHKVKEATLLKASNTDLLRRIDELEGCISKGRETEVKIVSLARELAESQACRDELMIKLQSIKVDHESVVENLRQCLLSKEKLVHEKAEWDEERGRLIEKSALELQGERLQHNEAVIELRSRDKEIEAIRLHLHESRAEVKTLNVAINDECMQRERAVTQAQLESSDEIRRVTEATQEQIQCMTKNHEKIIDGLRMQLQGKDDTITFLEDELAKRMHDLMTASLALERLKDEAERFESLAVDIERLEHERSSLEGIIHERDMEITELSAEILKMECEKEITTSDSCKVRSLQLHVDNSEAEIRKLRQGFKSQLDSYCAAIAKYKVDAVASNESQVEMQQSLNSLEARVILLQEELEQERSCRTNEGMVADDIVEQLKKRLHQAEAAVESERAQRSLIEEHLKAQLRNGDSLLQTERTTNRENAQGMASKLISLESNMELERQRHCKLIDEIAQLRFTISMMESDRHCFVETIETKDKTVATLEKELIRLRGAIADASQAASDESKVLRNELRAAKTALVLKDDEIRDLRIIELKDQEETITTLNSELTRLRIHLDSSKHDTNVFIDSLNQDISRQKIRISDLESSIATRAQTHLLEIDELTDKVSVLQRERDRKESLLTQANRSLVDALSDNEHLKEKCSAFDSAEVSLRREIRLQQSKIQENEAQLTKITASVDAQQREECKIREKVIIENQGKLEVLASELKACRKSLELKDFQLAHVEAELQRRTEQIEDISTRKRLLGFFGAGHDPLNAELQINDDALIEEIYAERRRRQTAEDTCGVLRSQLEISKRESKCNEELRKELDMLKDKIRRQNKYMKQKLEKERVTRERVVGGVTTSASKSSNRTSEKLSRLMPPTSRRGALSGIPSIVNSRASTATHSTGSLTLDESIDLELDTLLGDDFLIIE